MEGCEQPVVVASKGWCRRHYKKWQRYGDPLYRTIRDLSPSERFWPKVDKQEDGCWIWTAGKDWDGYGIFSEGGRSHRAHRWSYEECVAPIPNDLVLDHLCRVVSCVNPDHLEPVTPRVNFCRGETNATKVRCKWGHPLWGRNLIVQPSGKRNCRKCGNESTRRYRLRTLGG